MGLARPCSTWEEGWLLCLLQFCWRKCVDCFILRSFLQKAMSTSAMQRSNSDETTDERLASSKLKVILSFTTGAFSFKALIVLLPTFFCPRSRDAKHHSKFPVVPIATFQTTSSQPNSRPSPMRVRTSGQRLSTS